MLKRALFIVGLAMVVASAIAFGWYATRSTPSEASEAPLILAKGTPQASPVEAPTDVPTGGPTQVPTGGPTTPPTAVPTAVPTAPPTAVPTAPPTAAPTPSALPLPSPTPTDTPSALSLAPRSMHGHMDRIIGGRWIAAATPTPTPHIRESIRATYPSALDKSQTSSVRVELLRTPVALPQPNPSAVVVLTPIPVYGTPGVPVERAYGPNYDAKAASQLHVIGLTCDGCTGPLDWQPLDPTTPVFTWDWGIGPGPFDRATMRIEMLFKWTLKPGMKPGNGGQPEYAHAVHLDPIQVDIRQSWWSMLFPTLVPLGTGLLGSAFSAPFLYGIYKDRKEERDTKRKPSPRKKTR